MRHFDADQQRPAALYENQADLIAIINHHWREQDQRWRATNRIDRTLVRELTISRLLLGAMLVIQVAEIVWR